MSYLDSCTDSAATATAGNVGSSQAADGMQAPYNNRELLQQGLGICKQQAGRTEHRANPVCERETPTTPAAMPAAIHSTETSEYVTPAHCLPLVCATA